MRRSLLSSVNGGSSPAPRQALRVQVRHVGYPLLPSTLNALIDQPAALAQDPLLVKRLRRLRASRQRSRSAKRLGIDLSIDHDDHLPLRMIAARFSRTAESAARDNRQSQGLPGARKFQRRGRRPQHGPGHAGDVRRSTAGRCGEVLPAVLLLVPQQLRVLAKLLFPRRPGRDDVSDRESAGYGEAS